MMFKLGRACYEIKHVKHFMSQNTLRIVLLFIFSFHPIVWCIFWGTSACRSNIFKIKKSIIRIITNARNRDSFHQLFKNLKILPLKSQYIFPLLLFVAKNRDLYESNSEIHNINTRFSSELHTPTVNLITFPKVPFNFGIKIVNHLPISFKMHRLT